MCLPRSQVRLIGDTHHYTLISTLDKEYIEVLRQVYQAKEDWETTSIINYKVSGTGIQCLSLISPEHATS